MFMIILFITKFCFCIKNAVQDIIKILKMFYTCYVFIAITNYSDYFTW